MTEQVCSDMKYLFIFASLMDLCHPKHSEIVKFLQPLKGRAVLQKEKAKDDMEQGASASQVAAATFLDTMSR